MRFDPCGGDAWSDLPDMGIGNLADIVWALGCKIWGPAFLEAWNRRSPRSCPSTGLITALDNIYIDGRKWDRAQNILSHFPSSKNSKKLLGRYVWFIDPPDRVCTSYTAT